MNEEAGSTKRYLLEIKRIMFQCYLFDTRSLVLGLVVIVMLTFGNISRISQRNGSKKMMSVYGNKFSVFCSCVLVN